MRIIVGPIKWPYTVIVPPKSVELTCVKSRRAFVFFKKHKGPARAKDREHFEASTIVHIKLSARVQMKSESIVNAAAEEDLLGIQGRKLSAGIVTLAEIILGSGLLGRKPLWSITEFARELSVTLSTASHMADKPVRKHAVKRGRSPHDRRLVLISLSGRNNLTGLSPASSFSRARRAEARRRGRSPDPTWA